MSKKSNRLRKVNSKTNNQVLSVVMDDLKFRLVFEGFGVGIGTGIVISLFRLILSHADNFRFALIDGAKQKFIIAVLALLIFAFLAIITVVLLKIEPKSAGSGIPLVKGELDGLIKVNWYKVLITKFFGAIACIYAGLSVGHEGPSIQLGAMVGKGFSRLTGRLSEEEKYLMIAGAGAGIAAAFNAPLAGVLFVLEEFRRKFSHKALLSTMAASVVADWISSTIFGLTPVFDIELVGPSIPIMQYWVIVLLGIVLGAFGYLHNASLLLSQRIFGNLKPAWLKVALPMVAIIILAIVYPVALGSGHGLLEIAQEETAIKALLILLVVKFVFSMFSSGFGAPGGILLPLLVMGAVAGSLFSQVINPIFGYDTAIPYYVVLGMAGYFSAIVRTPITGIVLISEMTGALTNMLPLSIVTLVAYVTAELIGAKPIYQQLYEKMFKDKLEKGEVKVQANKPRRTIHER